MRNIICKDTAVSIEVELLVRTFMDKTDVELIIASIMKGDDRGLTPEQVIDKTIEILEEKLKEFDIKTDYEHTIIIGDSKLHFDRKVLEEVYNDIRI